MAKHRRDCRFSLYKQHKSPKTQSSPLSMKSFNEFGVENRKIAPIEEYT